MSEGRIELTPLYQDIKSVIEAPDKGRNIRLEATIHTEKEDFRPLKVLMLQNQRDYYKQTGESFHLIVLMAMGDYTWRLLPFRDHLEISLKTLYQHKNGDLSATDPTREIRFKALIDTEKANPYAGGDTVSNMEIESLNISSPPLEVTFELVDRCEEVLRLLQIDGTFPNVTMEQMLHGVFTHKANKTKVDGKAILQVTDVYPPDNKKTYPDLIIPSGTLLRDLPGYLQEKSKGVYTAGIGGFFQRYHGEPAWFVYPLFRLERFDEDCEKLVIYSAPQEKFPSLDQTYRKEGKVTYVVSTGVRKIIDDSRNPELNNGTGFRMSNAESMMLKPLEVKEEGLNANRNRLNWEASDGGRKDQLSVAPVRNSSANPYTEYSRVVSKNFSLVTLAWENSDPDVVYPGMPCKYVYMDKGKYTETKGIIVKCNSVTQIQGNPMMDTPHRTMTNLQILIEPLSHLPDNEPGAAVQEKTNEH